LKTPLHFAVSTNEYQACHVLINNGSDINALDINGFTPIIICALNGNVQICELLLTHGANISEDV